MAQDAVYQLRRPIEVPSPILPIRPTQKKTGSTDSRTTQRCDPNCVPAQIGYPLCAFGHCQTAHCNLFSPPVLLKRPTHIKNKIMNRNLTKILLTTTALFAASALSATIVLSTSFTEAANDSNFNDGSTNRGVGILLDDLTLAGGLSNTSITSLETETLTWTRTVGFGNRMFTTFGDGSFFAADAGVIPSGTRDVSSGRIVVTGGEQFVGFNSVDVGRQTSASPANVGIFNFVFEVDNTFSAPDGLEISLRAGTISTGGTWENGTAAQNGFWQARILPVTVVGTAGTIDYTGGFTFGATAAIGAGAGITVTGSTLSTLSEGTHVLQIIMSDKDGGQRFGIDDLTLTAIPEPRVYAALFGLLALGFVARRRRRR